MDQFHGMKESVFKRSMDVEEEEEDLSTLDIVKGLDDEFRDGAKELLLSAFKRGAKNTTKTVSSSFAKMVPGGKLVLKLCAEIYGRGMKLSKFDDELKMTKELVRSLAEEVVMAVDAMNNKRDFTVSNLVDALKACYDIVVAANAVQSEKLTILMVDDLKKRLICAQNKLKEACNAMSFAWVAEHERTLQDMKADVSDVNARMTHMEDTITSLQTQEKSYMTLNASLREVLKPLAFGAFIDEQASRVVAGTRQWAFSDFKEFVESPSCSVRILVASAGVGKTGIMSKLTRDFPENVVAYFFCRHDDSEKRDPKAMLCTLAYQLSNCKELEDYKATLQNLISSRADIDKMNVTALFDKILKEPLHGLRTTDDRPVSTKVMLIDALDECEHDGTNNILECIAKHFVKLPKWLKIFITSRPETPIMTKLRALNPTELLPEESKNMDDLRLFFRSILKGKIGGSDDGDAVEEAAETLTKKSKGLFIYASKVGEVFAQLDHISYDDINSSPDGIYEFYEEQFKRFEEGLLRVGVTLDTLMMAVGFIIVSREPLHVECLQELLGIADTDRIRLKLFKVISSLFPVRDSRLHVYHKSVTDWLLDEDREFHTDDTYKVEKLRTHGHLALRCREFITNFKSKDSSKGLYEYAEEKLTAMASSKAYMEGLSFALRHGVYHGIESELDTLGTYIPQRVSEVENPPADAVTFDEKLKLRAWLEKMLLNGRIRVDIEGYDVIDTDHVVYNTKVSEVKSNACYRIAKRYRDFDRMHAEMGGHCIGASAFPSKQQFVSVMRWRNENFIEARRKALSKWMKSLIDMIKGQQNDLLTAFVDFIMPSQLPAIEFWRCISARRSWCDTSDFWRCLLLSADWLLARALVGDGFSMKQDCELYLSAFKRNESTPHNKAVYYMMRCLGLALGGLAQNPQQICGQLVGRLLTLEESNDDIKSLVQSVRDFRGYEWWCPLNAALTQANDPCISILNGHTGEVNSVCYSHDGSHVVSGSGDDTVRIWNARTGEMVHELKGHTREVTSVCYSHDGSHVVSGSDDKTVRIWNASTGAPENIFKAGELPPEYCEEGGGIVGKIYNNSSFALDAAAASVVGSPDGTLAAIYYANKVLFYQKMSKVT